MRVKVDINGRVIAKFWVRNKGESRGDYTVYEVYNAIEREEKTMDLTDPDGTVIHRREDGAQALVREVAEEMGEELFQ